MKIYTHMIVRKTTGRVLSRHSSYELALKKFKKENSGYAPLEVAKLYEIAKGLDL